MAASTKNGQLKAPSSFRYSQNTTKVCLQTAQELVDKQPKPQALKLNKGCLSKLSFTMPLQSLHYLMVINHLPRILGRVEHSELFYGQWLPYWAVWRQYFFHWGRFWLAWFHMLYVISGRHKTYMVSHGHWRGTVFFCLDLYSLWTIVLAYLNEYFQFKCLNPILYPDCFLSPGSGPIHCFTMNGRNTCMRCSVEHNRELRNKFYKNTIQFILCWPSNVGCEAFL